MPRDSARRVNRALTIPPHPSDAHSRNDGQLPMSKTFVVCAVAANLIAALLAEWPDNLLNAMVAGIVVGFALGTGFWTRPAPLAGRAQRAAGRAQPVPPSRGLY